MAGAPHVVAAVTLASTIAMLPVYLVGALSIFVREEIPLSDAQLGTLVTIYFGVSAAAALPAAHIEDRIGPRKGLMISVLLSAASLLAIAAMAQTWQHIAAALVVSGAANAFAQPATNLALAKSVPVARQGLAFGIKQCAVPLSTLAGGAAVPLLGLTVGWRWSFILAAALAGLYFLVDAGTVPSVGPGRVVKAERRPMSRMFLLSLSLGGALAVGVANAMSAFYVPAAVTSGLPAGFSGTLLAVGSLCGISARVFWGWRADVDRSGQVGKVAAMLAVGAVGFAMLSTQPNTAVFVLGTALVFGAGLGWNGLVQLTVVRTHLQTAAAATAIVAMGIFIGSVVGPLAFGHVVEQFSYPIAWMGSAGVMLVASALVLAGHRVEHRRLLLT